MKGRKFIALGAAALALFATSCGGGAKRLGAPVEATPLSYAERREEGAEFDSLLSAANDFAARFAPRAVKAAPRDGNRVVSPVSVFMALALAAECASGETQKELYSALGAPETTVRSEFSDFYRSLTAEYRDGRGKLSAQVCLGNSVWVNAETPTRPDCIATLATDYHCYSYSADFRRANAAANRSVRNFVKERTNGLIDRDFQLPEETLFALINTLYLKDTWNDAGVELPLTESSYEFIQADGSVKSQPLAQGDYATGRVYEAESFSSFFAVTDHGYRLHFLVPKEGTSAEEIFTEETLSDLRNADYGGGDPNVDYFTRCLFPEFGADFDETVNETLRELGIERLFLDPAFYGEDGCGFEGLTEEKCFCKKVQHVAKLEVKRRGIEGAAVTVVGMDAAQAPDPGEREKVYEDFLVDRAFGFVLTDPYGVTLFSGVVGTI